VPALTVRGPSGPHVRYELSGDAIAIGRSAACTLVVLDRMVSRTHVRMRRDGAHWLVEDLDSRNGTRRNGAPLVGARKLAPDDEIGLGWPSSRPRPGRPSPRPPTPTTCSPGRRAAER
jgi:pSer/pThr/pTyr-binding forkhead associated (FHA) protein